MTLRLIFSAVAEERHMASLRELLHQTQRELLAVVLNGTAAFVNRAVQDEFPSILP